MDIKRKDLVRFYNFLSEASLVGAASRARTKLAKDILDSVKELQNDEMENAKEFEGKTVENGSIDFPDTDSRNKFIKVQAEMYEEEVIFSEKVKDQFSRLKNAFDNYDKPLQGEEAQTYDDLMDALESE